MDASVIIFLVLIAILMGLSYVFLRTAKELKDARGFEPVRLREYLKRVLENGSVGDIARFSSGANQLFLNFSIYGDKKSKGIDWIIPVSESSRRAEENILSIAQKFELNPSVETLEECRVIFVNLGDLSSVSQRAILNILEQLGVQNTKIVVEDIDFVVPTKALRQKEIQFEFRRKFYPNRRDIERLFSSGHSFLSSSDLPLIDCSEDQCI